MEDASKQDFILKYELLKNKKIYFPLMSCHVATYSKFKCLLTTYRLPRGILNYK